MKSTTRFKNNKKGIECLNCGQPLQYADNFCSNCGQVNDELPLSIKQFISEFFAGFFSFDTRFFKTIGPLLFKPGKVSKEYIQGKRKKYTNPFQLYLHTSIVFFLLTALLSTINNIKSINEKGNILTETNNDSFQIVLDNDSAPTVNNLVMLYNKKLDSIFKEKEYLKIFNADSISKHNKDSLYQELIALGMRVRFLDDLFTVKYDKKNKKSQINTHTQFVIPSFSKERIKEAHLYAVNKQLFHYFKKKHVNYQRKLPENKYNATSDSKLVKFYKFYSKNKEMPPADALDSLNFAKSQTNLFLYLKTQDLHKLTTDKEFQKSYLKAVISKISIAFFFLLPVLSLIFSLLYIRHPYHYTEHLVVVFNIQTVFFLLMIVGVIVDAIFSSAVFIVLLQVTFIFYVYKTLRNFYGQGHFKSIIKFFFINITYLILAVFGVIMISFLAFFI